MVFNGGWIRQKKIRFWSELFFRVYLVLRIRERYVQGLHGSDHGLYGRVDVLVDQFDIAHLVFGCVSSSVYNPHLFNEGTFPTFSSTW